jgi:hypothetical protein
MTFPLHCTFGQADNAEFEMRNQISSCHSQFSHDQHIKRFPRFQVIYDDRLHENIAPH